MIGEAAVVFLILLFVVLVQWSAERSEPRSELYCTQSEGQKSIDVESQRAECVYHDGKATYGYKCSVCENVHLYHFGTPAPVYVGDRIRFKITSEGLVREE